MDDDAKVAHAFFDALEGQDFDRAELLFPEGGIIWHSRDQRAEPRSEALTRLRSALSGAQRVRYAERRYDALPNGGAACQHTIMAVEPKGERPLAYAMCRVQVRDGVITRIEEYNSPPLEP